MSFGKRDLFFGILNQSSEKGCLLTNYFLHFRKEMHFKRRLDHLRPQMQAAEMVCREDAKVKWSNCATFLFKWFRLDEKISPNQSAR